MIRTLAIAFLALFGAIAAAADVPPLLLPPHADSVRADRPAAPLLVPGRPTRADSAAVTPERAALEQYALGRELERQQHPAAAIAAYRRAVKLDPKVGEAHFRMGRLFSVVGQHKIAAQEYEAELVHHPAHRPSARGLGLEQAQLGDTAAAVARLHGLVLENPDDEPSWQAYGFALSVAGRLAEGEHALRRALTLDPRDADAWRDLGVVLAAQHRDDAAREAYGRALELDPGSVAPLVNLGNLEHRAGHAEAALDAYRRATARDSSDVLAWRGQVTMLEELGRTNEAGDVYRRWLATGSSSPSLRMEAMEHFDSIGRKDIALELAREGVRRAPKSPEAHLALGMALHEAGLERESLGELRRAERAFARAESSARVGALIRAMRAGAPDSLRAVFAADSVANEAHALRMRTDSLYVAPLR